MVVSFPSAPNRLTRFLDTSGAGAWSPGPVTRHPLKRVYGTSVMYGDGKFLVMGGSDKIGTAPTNTAETLDLNTPAPAWQWANPMTFPRKHCKENLIDTLIERIKTLFEADS